MTKLMDKYLLFGIVILGGILCVGFIAIPNVFAHQNGCHRWHSCPSDTGSYVCGDTGYCSECPDNNYCKAGQPILSTSTSSYSNSGSNTNLSSNITNSYNNQRQAVSSAPAQVGEQASPPWIKSNAKWWSEGKLSDSDFVKGIQYLVQNGIVKVLPSPGQYLQNSNHIPSWIKHTAGWWADGKIDDSEFLKGIEYLVQTGIIQVSLSQSVNQPEGATQSSDMIPTSCNAVDNGVLPDPNCTPGAIDPRVTQDNIESTICVVGYTKTVRPSVSVTEPQKLESMKEYGFTDSPSNYEFDHLIPLELGGAPDDMKNFWPEPYSTAHAKDSLENYLHGQVCSGDMTLEEAQHDISTDWYHYWQVSKN